MTESELQYRERDLERRERSFMLRETELSRGITQAEASYKKVSDKLKTITRQVEESTKRLDETIVTRREHEKDVERLIQERQELSGAISENSKTLSDLEVVIENRKADIETELTAWRDERRNQMAETVAAAASELDSIRQAIKAGEAEILNQRGRHQQIVVEIADATIALDTLKAETDRAVQAQTDRTVPLKQEITILEEQIKRLGATKMQLAADNDRLTLQNKQFIEYEVKARKILDTQDKTLRRRQTELAIGEQQLESQQSILRNLQ